jgi:DNA-binding PadR family transcriptional regulator
MSDNPPKCESPEMTKIDWQDLWKLFLSGIDNLECGTKLKNGRVYFNLRTHGEIPEKISKDHRYSIKRNDFEDITEIFNRILESPVPPADYLLWVLWVREEKFDLYWSPLKANDEFIRHALSLAKQSADAETIAGALEILVRGEYLHKDIEECGEADIAYSLTPKGKRVAEELFMPAKDGRLVYNKSASIAPQTGGGAQSEPEKERRSKAERIKKIKQTVRDFWKRTLNGENVTQKGIEQKHEWKESVLSKDDAQEFMEKISKVVEDAKKIHGNLRDIDDETRARLLLFVHKTTE